MVTSPTTVSASGGSATVNNLAIASDTVVVDTSNTSVQITPDSSTGKTTVIMPASSTTSQLKTGSPLVIGPTTGNPEGFLGKVDQVTNLNGQVQVTASPGKLSDFISDCDISVNGALRTSDIQMSKPMLSGISYKPAKAGRYAQGIYRKADLITTINFDNVVLYDADNDPSTTNDQIVVNGSLDYGLDYTFELKASGFKLTQLQFAVTPWQSGSLTLSSSKTLAISKKVPIQTISFKPFTINIPTPYFTLPVVITPQIVISLGCDGNLSAGLATGFTESADITGGILFSNNQWQPISSQNISFTVPTITVSASANVTAYIEPKVTFKIYGQVAPYASPRGYLRFSADTSADPWWDLYGGLTMGVGITVDVLGYNLVDYEKGDVIGYEQLIASPPVAPINLTVNGGDGKIDVAWDPVSDAASYTLYWDTVPIVSRYTSNKITNVTSPYVHSGLTNNTTYYYMVTAENSFGESAGSSTVSTTPVASPPGTPTGVSALAGNGQVTVSWNAVSGATSYNIYYGTTTGVDTSSTLKSTGITTTSKTIIGLANGTTYYFIVTAVSSSGESAVSIEVSASPLAVPGIPTGLSATAGDGQVTVNWTVVTGAASYNIYYGTSTGITTSTGTKVTGVTAGSAIGGLTNGTTYYFIVAAVNAGGESATSSEASATPHAAITIPSAPTNVNATAGDGQATISWTAVSGATSYNVYYGTSAGVTTANGIKVTGATSGSAITGLTNGTTYYFIVTAVNPAGESVASATVSASPTVVQQKIPNTGQTTVYQTNDNGTFSAVNALSYTDNGDGTVTDNNTGLMWQKCSAGLSGAGCATGTAATYNWYQATGTYDATYNASTTNVCAGLNLAGHADWRLPTVTELIDIVNYGTYGPAINGTYFPATLSWYWSSTTVAGGTANAWPVNFNVGYMYNTSGKTATCYVRCVRP